MTKCHAVPAKDDKTILRVEALPPPLRETLNKPSAASPGEIAP